MSKEYELYKRVKKESAYYDYATYVLGYDFFTVCPTDGKQRSSEVSNYFAEKSYELTTKKEYLEALNYLNCNSQELSKVEKMAVSKELEDLAKTTKMPNEILFKYYQDISNATIAWEKGRKTLDFTNFESELQNIIDYHKTYIKLYETDTLKGYDVLLNMYEDGLTTKMCDSFFKGLEDNCLETLKKCQKGKKLYNKKLDTLKFDIAKQKELSNYVTNLMGYTKDRGHIGETTHPFTSGRNSNDVRITTHYHEDALFTNLYSIMHESGHALYDLNNDKDFDGTVLFGGTSMGIHESQSRFYENYLGRSREFIEFLYPKLIELYPKELDGITLDDIYYYINTVSSKQIRITADELSYSFHVIIRYEVEKKIFNEGLEIKDIEKEFNKLCLKYFGAIPENKKVGCYQDSHWASMFGYFPTYAIGNVYGAMFYKEMEKAIDIKANLSNGNFDNINNWLKENIQKYGRSKKNYEIMKDVTNEAFNPQYYFDYLNNKFRSIYRIK